MGLRSYQYGRRLALDGRIDPCLNRTIGGHRRYGSWFFFSQSFASMNLNRSASAAATRAALVLATYRKIVLVREVRAKNAEGFDDRTRRTVSENAKNLGAKAAEFE